MQLRQKCIQLARSSRREGLRSQVRIQGVNSSYAQRTEFFSTFFLSYYSIAMTKHHDQSNALLITLIHLIIIKLKEKAFNSFYGFSRLEFMMAAWRNS